MARRKIQILVILIICGSVFSASCKFPSADFSEYRGINYISDYQLTDPSWQLSEGVVDNSVSPPFEYMKFTPETTTITDGLPPNPGEIYRLEVVNLMPNGGFENPLANWTLVENATITPNNTDNGRVHNNIVDNNSSIKTILPDADSYINFNLRDPDNGLLDGFKKDKQYIIRNNFRQEKKDSIMYFEFNNTASTTLWTPKNKSETLYTEFPFDEKWDTKISATTNSTTHNFTIGSITKPIGFLRTEGFIDDLRIVRSDIKYFLRLSVPYKQEGRPDLVPGKYRFSFYVLTDGENYISPENRMASPRISFGFRDGTREEIKSLDKSDYSNSKWTEVYIEKDISNSIELLISPVDSTGLISTLDMGSIFIAFPQLYYVSE